MELALKQRLVGASVIIALVVIFVPMIFDNSNGNRSQTISIEIPGEPEDLKHKVISIDSKTISAANDKAVERSTGAIRKEPIKTRETIIDMVDNSLSRNKDNVADIEKKQTDKVVPVTKTGHGQLSDSKKIEVTDVKKNQIVNKKSSSKKQVS